MESRKKNKRQDRRQKQKERFNIMDYLWWLGEKTDEYYHGQPRRPDGESMILLCFTSIVFYPLLLIAVHIDRTLSICLVALYVVVCLSWTTFLHRRIYNTKRRKEVMKRFARWSYSPGRAYIVIFAPFLALFVTTLIVSTYHNKPADRQPYSSPTELREMIDRHTETSGRELPSIKNWLQSDTAK